jgi:hypothetical protein
MEARMITTSIEPAGDPVPAGADTAAGAGSAARRGKVSFVDR